MTKENYCKHHFDIALRWHIGDYRDSKTLIYSTTTGQTKIRLIKDEKNCDRCKHIDHIKQTNTRQYNSIPKWLL